uniref:Uncharacterized protein n=1 Tax=Timema cristinae TaxID=61476 RepID=A0A7R9HAR6_TIMCR|nr:unnamed protein product [Timema cristinae]
MCSGVIVCCRDRSTEARMDLEAQREQGNTRIAQLEEELVEDQRKKVRENVELIRLNRSLALQAVQVASLEAEKQTLERDREQLQEALRQAVAENGTTLRYMAMCMHWY